MLIAENPIQTGEVIGLNLKVIESSHNAFLGIEGKVVMESKNTISIRTDNGQVKTITKASAGKIFLFGESCGCFINGLKLIGKPEDRVSIS